MDSIGGIILWLLRAIPSPLGEDSQAKAGLNIVLSKNNRWISAGPAKMSRLRNVILNFYTYTCMYQGLAQGKLKIWKYGLKLFYFGGGK